MKPRSLIQECFAQALCPKITKEGLHQIRDKYPLFKKAGEAGGEKSLSLKGGLLKRIWYHTSSWTLRQRDRKHEPSTLTTESQTEEGQISGMPNTMRAIHRWFDEIEQKDAMQETFIRFATYLVVPAPQAGVAYTSFAQRGSGGRSKQNENSLN